MHTRRSLLLGSLGAPVFMNSAASGAATTGLTRDELPTPALLLDLDAFESNVKKMVGHAKRSGKALRPHGKTHKCPEIAKRLVAAGAVGACGAKISEAEVFGDHGVGGLLVTTAVIGKPKIAQAVRLTSKHDDTILCVDDPGNVRDLNEAAGAAGVKLNLAVDLLVGGRTGIQPGDPALKLAQLIDKLPHVRLQGIQAYCGPASHVVGFEERKKRSLEAMAAAVETRRLFERSGISCDWLSGASTGTYNIDSQIDGVTELQPGSFMFMDLDYNRIGSRDGEAYLDFQSALTVLTTVVSKTTKEYAVVDGGLKAFSTDRKFGPRAKDIGGLGYSWGGDEHGKIDLRNADREVKLGDRIEFLVPHCDPTVNLYNRLYCLRGGKVEAVWEIAARGRSQ